ncbi:hypothetical protein ORV05_23145 [Amycolatopsis cynarae]|uniref:Integral membrane protein n=1 Tax=Amycolatopsis cynarae TaxID=2995223 RepID=A0ABY7AZ54_9PSEU|nr:hypothetical protein [Amycolatopsis sp. HUAS 11-8]WAL63878.1 hypothetical protein ORV05_23145 [Amycolatopsis sp. HUAS 11-8]
MRTRSPGRDAEATTTTDPLGEAMNTTRPGETHLGQPGVQRAFRAVKLLIGTYTAVSVLTLVAIVALRGHASVVNDAVWIRGTLVLVSSLLTMAFALRAARGSRAAYLRLRIVSAVMVLAIAVIVAVPGPFPVWMKIEQGGCGLVLAGVVAIVYGKRLRAVFAR